MHVAHPPAASPTFPQCDGLGRDMLSEELSTDMDRITQLQDAILDLLTITSASIEYITHRTQFEQTSAAIPTTLQTAQAARRKEYRGAYMALEIVLVLASNVQGTGAAIETFVADIVRRAKDVETLTAALPSKDDSGARAVRLQELQVEMVEANAEYKEALKQAEALLGELREILRVTLGDGTEGNIVTSLGRLGLPT